jgi:hypothetical protein
LENAQNNASAPERIAAGLDAQSPRRKSGLRRRFRRIAGGTGAQTGGWKIPIGLWRAAAALTDG